MTIPCLSTSALDGVINHLPLLELRVFPGHGILSFKTGTVLGKQGQFGSPTLGMVNSSSAVSNFRLLNYPLWCPYTPSLSL